MKAKSRLTLRKEWLLIPVSILMGIGMWYYFDRVGVAAQVANDAAKDSPRGNLSDLYPRWLGAREMLIHQRDPYSREVTLDIQKGFWGRPIDPRNPNDPTDEVRFAYPLYVVFLMAPTINWPFESVQTWYMAIAAAVSILSVWWWWRVFAESGSVLWIAVASTLLLGSYPVVQGLHSQQLVLLVAALIAGGVAATAAGAFWAAGVMLALATIKPQVTVAIAAWLLLWSASKWRERKALCLSFLATMTVLLASAELLLPGWFWKWREALSAYMRYAPLPSATVQLIFGEYVGPAVGAVVLAALGVFCWKTRLDSPSTNRFKLVPPLILTIYLAVSPVWHSYDHMLLLPSALLAFRWRDEYFRLKPFGRAVLIFSIFVFSWSWISAITLYLTSRASPALAQSLVLAPLYSTPFTPLCALASLVLIGRERALRASSGAPA